MNTNELNNTPPPSAEEVAAARAFAKHAGTPEQYTLIDEIGGGIESFNETCARILAAALGQAERERDALKAAARVAYKAADYEICELRKERDATLSELSEAMGSDVIEGMNVREAVLLLVSQRDNARTAESEYADQLRALREENEKLSGYYGEIVQAIGHDCILREYRQEKARADQAEARIRELEAEVSKRTAELDDSLKEVAGADRERREAITQAERDAARADKNANDYSQEKARADSMREVLKHYAFADYLTTEQQKLAYDLICAHPLTETKNESDAAASGTDAALSAVGHIVDIMETKARDGVDIELGSTAFKSLLRWAREARAALSTQPAPSVSDQNGGAK